MGSTTNLDGPPSRERDIASTFEAAVRAHQAGELGRARALYRQILSWEPRHADSLQLLGVLAQQQGDPAAGAALIRRAIEQRADVAAYHNNLGNVLLALGEESAALDAYREAVRLEPEDPDGQFNLGSLLGRRGDCAGAETALREAARLRPGDAEIHCTLGTVLRQSRRLDEAASAYREALGLNPRLADAHRGLGYTLHLLGWSGEAERAYRHAIELEPGHAASHHNLGNVLSAQGQWTQALEAFARACTLDARSVETRLGLARAQRETRDLDAALRTYQQCLRLEPTSFEARRGLAGVARFLRPDRLRPELEPDLVACFAEPRLEWQELAGIAANQLVHKYGLHHRRWDDASPTCTIAKRLAHDELALALLSKSVNVNATLEACLVALRRELVASAVAGNRPGIDHARLACALATQCFHNEYVYELHREEARLVEAIRGRIASHLAAERLEPGELEPDLTLLAMYEAPASLPFARRLADVDFARWSAPMAALMRCTVVEPLLEAAIEPTIECVGEITDATSRAVREQYEQNPYPRWLNLPAVEGTSIASMLREKFPRFTPQASLHGAVSVLVAGCGTGREPLEIARTCPDADVVAVDLSRRSLAYAMRKARELEVHNVRFVHGDILALQTLGRTFDVIVSTGVLHHLDEPMAGWRNLTGLLRAGGVMRVGLYSRRARRVVEEARRLIRRLDIEPTPAGIRHFRTRLLAGDLSADLSVLERSDDLYTMSTCRDLLFHACERQFSPIDIDLALEALGLEFLGFELPDPTIRDRYRVLLGEDAELTDLASWDRFEARFPDSFVGMYQFWCAKS